MNVTWFFNDHTLVTADDMTVSKVSRRVSVLTIEAVAAHHIGNYTCLSNNSAGSDNFTAKLMVDGLFLLTEEIHELCMNILVEIYFNFYILKLNLFFIKLFFLAHFC